MKTENQTTYEIPLREAQGWVSAYQDGKPDGSIKGFLIAVDELNEIIKLSADVKYVRVYFGIDNNTPELDAKLLLVPVNRDGIDMINTTGVHSQVFDFTMPCPPTCDPGSPLYAPKLKETIKQQ